LAQSVHPLDVTPAATNYSLTNGTTSLPKFPNAVTVGNPVTTGGGITGGGGTPAFDWRIPAVMAGGSVVSGLATGMAADKTAQATLQSQQMNLDQQNRLIANNNYQHVYNPLLSASNV
jgi:hypothetical protein